MSIDFTRPLQTRSGYPVRILCTNSRNPRYPVIGVVQTPGGDDVHRWSLDGRELMYRETELDLVPSTAALSLYWQRVAQMVSAPAEFTASDDCHQIAHNGCTVQITSGPQAPVATVTFQGKPGSTKVCEDGDFLNVEVMREHRGRAPQGLLMLPWHLLEEAPK